MKKPSFSTLFFERLILAYPRRRLRKKLAEKLGAAIYAIEQVEGTRKKFANYSADKILVLYDASQFCLMYDADLTVLTGDMTCRVGWWESRLYGRLLAMTMLECVEDIPAVLGRSFRQALEATIPNGSSTQELINISKSLSDFRKQNEKQLRYIRKISAAHRDHDPRLIVEVIENLNVRALTQMATELNDLLGSFARAMTVVLKNINVAKVVIEGMSKKAEKLNEI